MPMRYEILFLLTGLFLANCAAPTPAATSSLIPTATAPAALTATPSPELTPTAAPLPEGKAITFDASGAEPLSGTLYGEGQTAILLANMSVGGEKQWDPFVATVDKQKFTTVTFNYRDIDDVAPDMEALLGWLKDHGFTRVICIGASLGTRACTTISLEPEIAGIVLIAGAVHHASVAEATYPKLFMAGALDNRAFDIQTGYEKAAEPRELVLFEANRAHGTDLFSSKDSERFLTALIEFVNGLANP